MFDVLAVEMGSDFIAGYLNASDEYVPFKITKDNNIDYEGFRYKKSEYEGVAHFAGVMGKFDPYLIFLFPVIRMKQFSFDSLYQALTERGVDTSIAEKEDVEQEKEDITKVS